MASRFFTFTTTTFHGASSKKLDSFVIKKKYISIVKLSSFFWSGRLKNWNLSGQEGIAVDVVGVEDEADQGHDREEEDLGSVI